MAFDLNSFLQDNKKFLAASVLGAGVFFVAYAVVDSYAGAELRSARAEVGALRAKMNNAQLYTAKNLEEAKAQQKELEATVEKLTARLNFDRRPQFKLEDGGASPANQYIKIAAKMREQRLDDARARSIDLVDNCGIPDRSPTETEDIRRTLRTLDLIDRVLELAIVPGVRSIDRIAIVSDKGGERVGKAIREEIRVEFEMVMTSPARSAFLEASQAFQPPITILAIDDTALGSASGGGRGDSWIRVNLVVAALDVLLKGE
jgi:hypothetical protein